MTRQSTPDSAVADSAVADSTVDPSSVADSNTATDYAPFTLQEPSFLQTIGLSNMNQTRGERNNNPGNIVKSTIPWQGKIAGNDSTFETFDTPVNGIRAIGRNLMAYYNQGRKTVHDIIYHWSATDQASYSAQVAAALGISEYDPVDLNNPATLQVFVNEIIRRENGRIIYASSVINSALGLA
jgi:hypothetical protein